MRHAQFAVELTTADVIGTRLDNDAPVFWRNSYGLGAVYVLCAPLEAELVRRPGAQDGQDAPAFSRIYHALKLNAGVERLAETGEVRLSVTEHRLGDGSTIVAILNHHRAAVKTEVEVKAGYDVVALRGYAEFDNAVTVRVDVAAFDAVILRLEPKATSGRELAV